MTIMKNLRMFLCWTLFGGLWSGVALFSGASGVSAAPARLPEPPQEAKVVVLPVKEEVGTPLVYLIRRGVKQAIEENASLLILDMDTNGGRVDSTEEIMTILNQFRGDTVTYVNRRAFSAGAFIAFATRRIYMAPQSVIGAAAPIMMAPGGGGPQSMPDSVNAKMTSAIAALVRAAAEKNGHNVHVVDAMVNQTKELEVDGVKLNEKGQILTLTSQEAERKYGTPPKPLVSMGTVESVEDLILKLGYGNGIRVDVKPTQLERLATFLNSQAVSSILLVIGIAGIYVEFKTPGFGLPGIAGISAFVLYFLGGYAAGLSGLEWVLLFFLGLALVAVEIFVMPGVMVIGLSGVAMMLVALVMALADAYPVPGKVLPAFPMGEAFSLPLQVIGMAGVLAIIVLAILSRLLPQTPVFRRLVSESASGAGSDREQEKARNALMGAVGITTSILRPGGKARFGEELLDVIAADGMIEKGVQVRVVGFSGREATVERVE